MPVRASRQSGDETQTTPETPYDASQQRTTENPEPERIARRAYERFQSRGSEHGRDQEDWFEAEREILGGGSE